MITIHISGIHSAPETLGFSRESRRNRKTINPTVRRSANLVGILFQRSEVRSRKSEVRGQRSEDGGLRSEIRDQRSEISGQRTEDGGRKTEVRSQKSEVSGQWSVVSSQWSVVSGQWSVVRGQWSAVSAHSAETGSWNSKALDSLLMPSSAGSTRWSKCSRSPDRMASAASIPANVAMSVSVRLT